MSISFDYFSNVLLNFYPIGGPFQQATNAGHFLDTAVKILPALQWPSASLPNNVNGTQHKRDKRTFRNQNWDKQREMYVK